MEDWDYCQVQECTRISFRADLFKEAYDAVAVEASDPEVKAQGFEHESEAGGMHC